MKVRKSENFVMISHIWIVIYDEQSGFEGYISQSII